MATERESEVYFQNKLPSSTIEGRANQIVEPDKNESKEQAKEALKDAGKGAFFSFVPIASLLGLMMLTVKANDGLGVFIKMAGIPFTIGGLAFDAIKFPFITGWTIGKLIEAGMHGIASVFKRSTHKDRQKDEVMKCFLKRFGDTIQLLISQNIVTIAEVDKMMSDYRNKVDSRGMGILCAMTILNTAYASRRLDNDSILLANGKILRRQDCPKGILEIFNEVIALKNTFRELGYHTKSNREISKLIIEYLPLLYRAIWIPGAKLTDKKLLDNARPGFMVPDERKIAIFDKIVELMRKTAKVSQDIKVFQKSSDDIKNTATNSISSMPDKFKQGVVLPEPEIVIIEEDKKQSESKNFLLDHETQEVITNAVIGSDGYPYNYETALRLQDNGKIERFYALFCAGGADKAVGDHEDLKIDPITCEEMTIPVIADDGYIYDETTVVHYITNKWRGFSHQPISGYIKCKDIDKWAIKNDTISI